MQPSRAEKRQRSERKLPSRVASSPSRANKTQKSRSCPQRLTTLRGGRQGRMIEIVGSICEGRVGPLSSLCAPLPPRNGPAGGMASSSSRSLGSASTRSSPTSTRSWRARRRRLPRRRWGSSLRRPSFVAGLWAASCSSFSGAPSSCTRAFLDNSRGGEVRSPRGTAGSSRSPGPRPG